MFKLVHLNLQGPLTMFKLIGKHVVGLQLKGLFVLCAHWRRYEINLLLLFSEQMGRQEGLDTWTYCTNSYVSTSSQSRHRHIRSNHDHSTWYINGKITRVSEYSKDVFSCNLRHFFAYLWCLINYKYVICLLLLHVSYTLLHLHSREALIATLTQLRVMMSTWIMTATNT